MPSSWILADLTVESGAPDIGGNPSSNAIYQNGQYIVHVVYNAVDNHIYELRLEPGQPWKVADLTAQSGAPDAVSNPFIYATSENGQDIPRVLYRAGNNHIYELRQELGQPWKVADLTTLSSAPEAAANLFAYAESVFYRALDNHIHELRLEPGQPWRQTDLTAQSSAPDAVSNPFGYAGAVFYRAQDFHIYELRLEPGQPWKVADLTAQSGAPNAVVGDPFVYNHFPGESMTTLVLYRAIDSHIHELSQGFEQPWKVADLTALSGASNAAGDPFAYITNIRSSRPTSRVIYHAVDNHIHELRLEPGQPWKVADLTALSGALNIVGDPTASVVWETTQDTARVFFHTTDNHIHELRLGITISG